MRIVAAVVIILATMAALAVLCVQYGRALESCHSDGSLRVPIQGCR